MRKHIAMLVLACLAGACPMGVFARPHHSHRAIAPPLVGDVQPAFVVHLQPISYDAPETPTSSSTEIAPRAIGPRDGIPMNATGRFGRGGVASLGYEPGSGKSLVEAHELNAAFSSQPFAFGGVVGGGVSLRF